MKAYLMTVVWAAVAGTLAELIGDDEGGGAKLLRLLTGLMILSVVISPLRGLLQTACGGHMKMPEPHRQRGERCIPL